MFCTILPNDIMSLFEAFASGRIQLFYCQYFKKAKLLLLFVVSFYNNLYDNSSISITLVSISLLITFIISKKEGRKHHEQ